MTLAYELKMDIDDIYAMGPQKIGWWFAWFKVKHEKDKAEYERRRRRGGKPKALMTD